MPAGSNGQVTGRIEHGIAVYKQLLESKTREYGEDSLQVARTLHDLGEILLGENRLAEAEHYLLRALRNRAAAATLPGDEDDEDDAAFKVRRDAAVTRDTLGRVYEQRNDFEAARGIRSQGLDKRQLMCGNQVKPRPQLCCVQLHMYEMIRECY